MAINYAFAQDFNYTSWGDVPSADQYLLKGFRDQFAALVGYHFDIPDSWLVDMANKGVLTLQDFGEYAFEYLLPYAQQHGMSNWAVLNNMPWARYGLAKDSYQQLATTYGVEYKKITGQDIPTDQLSKAFASANLAGGGILSGSQYAQQLMNDVNLQKQFGWIKYGLDFNQWTQQKLQWRTAFGRDIADAEAANLLQYNHQATGGSSVAARQQQQQAGGSVVR